MKNLTKWIIGGKFLKSGKDKNMNMRLRDFLSFVALNNFSTFPIFRHFPVKIFQIFLENWQNERKYYVFDVYVNYRPFPDSKFWSVFVLIRNVKNVVDFLNNSVIQLFKNRKNQQAEARRFRQLFQINELCLNLAKISRLSS